MRVGQAANYTRRIERVLDVIERRAVGGPPLVLAELADTAALSPFHFHRIYRLMTGETAAETLTRVRLGGSLPVLTGQSGIALATERSGYATQQAFARALRARSGHTPTQLRDDLELRERIGESLRRPAIKDGGGQPPLSIEIVSFEPVRLLALRNVGDYAELNRGYIRLFELLMEQIAPDNVTGLWGIPHDDPRFIAASQCRFDCAVSTDGSGRAAGDITQIDVPGGRCLRLRLPGDYAQVHAALDDLYIIAIEHDLELSDALPINFYHADPEEVPVDDLLTDIHLMLAQETFP